MKVVLILLSFALKNEVLSLRQTRGLKNYLMLAETFNSDFKISSWVIHCENIPNYDRIVINDWLKNKKKASGLPLYVTIHDVDTKEELPHYLFGPRVFHLYIGKNLSHLNQLFKLAQDPSEEIPVVKGVWLVKVDLFRKPFRDGTQIKRQFKSSPLRFDSLVFCFHEVKTGTDTKSIIIHDVYKINETLTDVELIYYGQWNPMDSMITLPETNVWKRRSNLKGHRLRIASMIYHPQSPYVVDGCTTPDCFVGYYPDIVHNLQRLMNFTYVIQFESVFGKRLQNGTWIGEIGLVKNRKVDFAVAPFGWRKDRLEVVDYVPMNPTGVGQIYIRNPAHTYKDGAFKVDWMTYFSPFTYRAWLGAILLCFIAPAIMTAIVIDWNNIRDPKSIFRECTKCYVAMFRSLIMIHNSESHDSKVRRRICNLTIVVSGMLIYWLWEADLITFFAFPSTALPFTTLKGLLDNSDLKVLLFKGSMHESYFRYSDDPVKKKIWQERIEPYIENEPAYQTRDGCELLEKIVQDGSFVAYHMFSGGEKRCKRYKDCSVKAIPEALDRSVGGGWTFPKKSPFRPIFAMYINLLKERGSYERMYDVGHNKTLAPDQTCPNYSGKPIGSKSYFLFVILIFGAGMSILAFILEHILQYLGKRSDTSLEIEQNN